MVHDLTPKGHSLIRKQTKEGYPIYVREGTTDWAIVGEVRRSYGWMEPKGERVLDIGGCFGAYALLAAHQGACHVWTYEPHPDNYRLLEMNCKGYPITSVNRAMIRGKDKDIKLYVGRRKSMSTHTILDTKGRDTITVKCANFITVLNKIKPTTLKIDCEGAEFELLSRPLPSYVKKVTVEIHYKKKALLGKPLDKLLETFHGWECVRQPKNNYFFTLGAWRRD